MSDIIHLLPDSVANQIAAGEVVQRPASVIKELLENSIDAHATEIQIVLKEAGRELIQVIDNGVGMSPTDARMAFERHATSKITQAADLFELHTMGFRGEALASIAAVAEVELRTRRADEEVGICLTLAGSRLIKQEVVSCSVGANFSVRNLFYNVPARRKFLKSNQTELSNIITELQHVALANPAVGFTLMHNDVVQLQLAAGSVRQRISALFAKTIGQQLLPIGVDNELLTIGGFICRPESARKKGALQYFFVNNRFMKHPYFHKAVMECYGDIIAEGEQPNYFIYLTVDASTIDVNIHPTKTEIKFENESARWHILMASVREALGKFNAVPSIDFDMEDAPEIPAMGGGEILPSGGGPSAPKPEFNNSYNPFRKERSDSHWEALYNEFATSKEHPEHYVDVPSGGGMTAAQTLPSSLDGGGRAPRFTEIPSGGGVGAAQTLPSSLGGGGGAPRFTEIPSGGGADASFLTSALGKAAVEMETLPGRDIQSSAADPESRPNVTSQEGNVASLNFENVKRYFQVGGRYILTAVKSGMIMIDQHRAHISILFDAFYAQICKKQGVSQSELFPELVSFSPADVPVLESILPELGYLGFGLDSLGGGSYAVNAKPAALGTTDMTTLLLSMIDTARGRESGVREELDRKLALQLAQSEAIPYGKILTHEEMEQLSDGLFALPMPNYTPDGKLVISLMSFDELAARF